MFFIKNSIYQKITTDYSWLVILFFILRLYGITDPPLEIQHNWRQCTGLMIARNFLTIDPNIFFPRLDDLCGKSNIIAFELQLPSFIHFIISKLLGYQHWYGRIIVLIYSSLGTYCFGYLISHFFNLKIAWYSVLSLTISSWFIFSRKMMPDTFSVSLVFISFYFGYLYVVNRNWYLLAFFFLFFLLGGLSKLPAAIYSVIPFCYHLQNRIPSTRNIVYSTIIALIMILVWYFIWGPYISQKYGNWTNLGQPFILGIRNIVSHPKEVLNNILFHSFFSYILFLLALFGLVSIMISKNKKIIVPIIYIFSLFCIYILKAGYFFYHHNYYMIPIIPVFAFVIGYGLANSNNKFILLIFTAGIIESIANQQHDFRIKPDQIYKLELESILNRLDNGEPKSPVLINTQSNPQQLYLANRRGCYISPDQMQDSNMLNSYKEKGYRWMVIDKYYENANSKKEIIYQDKHFIVYKL